ncbi:Na+/H+ antiporter subunit E [Actinoplanes friuliensis]|jgi:multicomponent Na+:H+ antiporter subunit E|uniref:Monovalent cation/H+ antiporter subunit E n=1 Tax=Actinoplanes friuliensis DSM 7358 TaxID=1246995 RepID=U5W565_9ACTN|nr:Na+/H+ antiporter subunit E [Actinoplanes friuliensis]AGZ44289.1 monovalent cation/H+ antiporter subunit E [Actinoplanes friuliensis DSM 7358]
MSTRWQKWRDRLVAAGGLTVIWVLLWGRPTPITIAGGLLVAAVILTVFPLPQVTVAGRINLVGVLRFAGKFLVDLVAASIQIALLAFRFGHVPRSAVIAVRLRAPSDITLTLTAEALSLVPGSLIVEVDREQGVLYVHVLGMRDSSEADGFRQSVLDLEARIVHALGSTADRDRISRKDLAA